jgi:hypothetical protein
MRFAARRPFRRHYLHGLQGRNGRNGVFVNELLPAVVFQNNRKIIKTPDHAFQLKTVDKVNNHSYVFFSDLVEETVLQIYAFAYWRHIHPSKLKQLRKIQWHSCAACEDGAFSPSR